MIKTPRLEIRPVTADDWRAIQRIWADAAQSPYAQYDRPNDLDDRAVQARIAKWAAYTDSEAHHFFAVCLAGAVIGYISLHRREQEYEIGYCFHSAYHRKGYAKEALSALLNAFAAQNARRFSVGTALNNTPSVRLLLSLGFTQTGSERVSFYQDAQGQPIVFEGGIFTLTL